MIERIIIDGRVYFKNTEVYWTDNMSKIAESVSRVLENDLGTSTIKPELRHQVGYYLSLCNIAGFAKTEKDLDACARRYLAGKRKVSPPFTKTRKNAAIKARKARESVPKEVLDQIDFVMTLPMAQNVNEKSINALVGMVLKKHKYNPQVVKELIQSRVS
jgi:hypothetical protein